MDWTTLQHAVIALVCSGIGWLCGDTYAGAAFGAALFLGREHAQAEYRWIERFGNGKRANLPFWSGFDSRVWDMGSIFDWVVPLVVNSIFAWFFTGK